MILEVKWRIIFSAHRKPNIGLAARNGEGKNPKQTAEERNSYQTRSLFILPIPGAGACRGETRWMRAAHPVFVATDKRVDPRLWWAPKLWSLTACPHGTQGLSALPTKVVHISTGRGTPSSLCWPQSPLGARGGVRRGKAKWNVPGLTSDEWFNLPEPHVWNAGLDYDFTAPNILLFCFCLK